MKCRNPLTKPEVKTAWLPFITKVLAFIGLWQVISNSAAVLTRWL